MSDFAITTTDIEEGLRYDWTATIDGQKFGAWVFVTEDSKDNTKVDKKVRELLQNQYERTVKAQICKKDGHDYYKARGSASFCLRCKIIEEEL